jgi:hypothetical protein
MWDYDLEKAKLYIREGRYDDARIILESLQGNYAAGELLKKLRRHQRKQSMQAQIFQPQQNVIINQNIQQLDSNKGCFGDIPKIPMTLVLINMALWACIMSFIISTVSGSEYYLVALCGISVWFALIILMQYLLWKFFWWMLAISWTLSTIILVLVASAISSDPTMFSR